MENAGLLIMNFLFVVLFWGISYWIFNYRHRPVKISSVFPLIPRYRKSRLHPLFRDRSDVIWLACWMFLLGVLFFIGLIINLLK